MNRGMTAAGAIAAALLLAPLLATPAHAEAIGTPVSLSTFDPVQTSTYGCGSASVATNPESTATLAAWIAPDSSAENGGVVQVVLLDADGAPVSTPVAASSALPSAGWNDCQPVSVSAGGDGGFLLVWTAADDSTNYGQLVSATGSLVGENFTVSEFTTYRDIETVTAAWSPESDRYLVTWKARVQAGPFPGAQNDQQIVGRFVDGSGAGITGDFLVTDLAGGINNSQAVAYGGGVWVVGGVDDGTGTPVVQALTTAGLQGAAQPLNTEGGGAAGVSLVYNGSTAQFLAVYRGGGVIARFLDAAGQPVGTPFVAEGSGGSRPRVAAAGADGYLIAWHDSNGVFARELLADGTPAEAAEQVVVSGAAGWRPEISFSASTGRYMIVWMGNPLTPNETNAYARAWFVREAEAPVEPVAFSAQSSSDEAVPGRTVTVSGVGATAGGSVTVALGDRLLASGTADAEGGYSIVVLIPTDAAPGSGILRVTDVESGAVVDLAVTIPAILPATGADVGVLAPAGALLLLLGASLVLVRRRAATRA